MTKFHRNFIDFLTDHEKHLSDRQTGCSGCARWKATPGPTGNARHECQKLHVFHTDQSLVNISHSPPTVLSLVIPVYPRFTLTAQLRLPGPFASEKFIVETILNISQTAFFEQCRLKSLLVLFLDQL